MFLTLARIHNSRNVLSWATVLTLSEYSRGTKECSIVANRYFGMHVSYLYIKSTVAKFWDCIQVARKVLLKEQILLGMCYDNTQIIVHLKYQWRGQSSTCMKGTVQYARKLIAFTTTRFDNIHTSLILYVKHHHPMECQNVCVFLHLTLSWLRNVRCSQTCQTSLVWGWLYTFSALNQLKAY